MNVTNLDRSGFNPSNNMLDNTADNLKVPNSDDEEEEDMGESDDEEEV